MDKSDHYRALENLYQAAPINEIYHPVAMISEGEAEIVMELTEKLHHAAGSAHGSVYFKMLDDAAFFAANSLEQEVILFTTSFTTYLTRPVSDGKLKAVGKVVNKNKTQTIAEAVIYNSDNIEIGRGNGVFMKSKVPFEESLGYSPD